MIQIPRKYNINVWGLLRLKFVLCFLCGQPISIDFEVVHKEALSKNINMICDYI